VAKTTPTKIRCHDCSKIIRGTANHIEDGVSVACDHCFEAAQQCDVCFNITSYDEGAVPNLAHEENDNGDAILCADCKLQQEQAAEGKPMTPVGEGVIMGKCAGCKRDLFSSEDIYHVGRVMYCVPCHGGLPAPICGVCQRPWIDGKCSGGFFNHRLDGKVSQ
jgi:hypothetical protein